MGNLRQILVPQCKIAVTAAFVNLLNTVWFARNEARFNNKHITYHSAISRIIASTSLSGNNTNKTSNKSVRDVLKAFRISIHHPRAPTITEVLWTKCNTDGASLGNPGTSSCGGIFRDFEGNCKGCFAEYLGLRTSYQAELCGVTRAIEIAYEKNWHNLWIESDSSLVVQAFKNSSLIPWKIRNQWSNAIFRLCNMNCIVTHIFRERNQVADSLANHGLTLDSLVCWSNIPSFAMESYVKNKHEFPNFRFSSH